MCLKDSCLTPLITWEEWDSTQSLAVIVVRKLVGNPGTQSMLGGLTAWNDEEEVETGVLPQWKQTIWLSENKKVY